MAHARVLAGIQDVENSYSFIEGAKAEEMSVRQMEDAARQLTSSGAATSPFKKYKSRKSGLH